MHEEKIQLVDSQIQQLAASLMLNRLCAMYIDEMSYVMGYPVSSRRYMGVEKY